MITVQAGKPPIVASWYQCEERMRVGCDFITIECLRLSGGLKKKS